MTKNSTIKDGRPLPGKSSAANIPRPAGPVMGPPKQHERGKGFELFKTTGTGGMTKGLEQGGLKELKRGLGKVGM